MADTKKPDALTYEEAAVRLGVSVQAIRNFVTDKKLKRGKRKHDNRLVVSAADVEKLAAERQGKQDGEVIWEQE